jgi:type I restriction enzyme S subunit
LRERKLNNSENCDAPDNLPEGWCWAKLSEIVAHPKADIVDGPFGSDLKASEYIDEGVPIVRLQNVDRNRFIGKNIRYISHKKAKDLKRHNFKPGDVIVTKLGDPLGKACIVPENFGPGIVVADIVRVRLNHSFSSIPYLVYSINSQIVTEQFFQHIKGTTRPRVNLGVIRSLMIALAPLSEQERIVAMVDELLGRVNSVRERLARVQAILKRFRQSVLSAACSGRLTADWRENHSDTEPASELLRRIKEKRLEAANTAKNVEQINSLYEWMGRKLAENEQDSNLPETWLACDINSIGKVCNGSTPSRRSPEYWGGGIPWVSSGEVRNNVITETKETISIRGYKNSSVRMLPKGTVLLAMIGEGKTRGQAAIIKIEATANQNIAAVIIDHGFVSSEYLWYWFQFQYEITRQVGGGTGPQALNCEMVRNLSLRLPPFEEQNEIVRRVEGLLKKADSIERRVAGTKGRVNILFQAILAKAFRGELVPTEAELARREGRTYEPAYSLLARIKAESDNPGGAVSKKRKNRASVKT